MSNNSIKPSITLTVTFSNLTDGNKNLPPQIRDDRILLIVGEHPSRYSFTACLFLYLFMTEYLCENGIDTKKNFKKELILERIDSFFQNGIDIAKQTANQLRDSLIKTFINSLRKRSTLNTIESGFKIRYCYI